MSANGYLAPSELTNIGNGLSLRTDAAVSFLAMAAAAWADGVQINWAGKAGAYRPWAMQLDMRVHPRNYGINPNMHSLPGLPSAHGFGTCRDVDFGAPNNWMIANAAKYGWTRPAYALRVNDLNHWEFTPGTATMTAGNGGTRIEEDEMQDADWKRLDLGLQSVIDQIRGDKAATILQVRSDLGYLRDTTFKSIQASITGLTVDASGSVDVKPLLDAIAALPEQTAAAVKAALKAAL